MASVPKSSLEDEKFGSSHIERTSLEAQKEVDPAIEKAIMRKVDFRVLVILGALYGISLIDRTNISVARVAGMATDLQLLVGDRYSIITLVFFIPYIIFELPSNIVLRKLGARVWLSAIVIAWGAVMLGMGYVKSYEQLIVCRTLLGVLESGFFPGCVFLISTWYTRYETQKRLALFYLTSMFLGGLSNIMGYGMSLLEGTHGIRGWRWIFIIFGAATIGLGLIAAVTIVDFPDKAKFLTKEESAIVISRVQRDRGDAIPDHLTMKTALKHVGDIKLWLFGLMFMSSTMPAYAFSYFLPVILSGSGYSVALSQILSFPPYAFAAIYTFAVAYGADKSRRRALFIILNSLVCTVGLLITAYAKPRNARYFGCFLAIAGCQANIPATLAYQANNVLSHSKRSVASAIVIGMGGVGGIFASTVYRQQDYPSYIPGLWATIGCQILIVLLAGALSVHFTRQNKKVDDGQFVIDGNPTFKYTI